MLHWTSKLGCHAPKLLRQEPKLVCRLSSTKVAQHDREIVSSCTKVVLARHSRGGVEGLVLFLIFLRWISHRRRKGRDKRQGQRKRIIGRENLHHWASTLLCRASKLLHMAPKLFHWTPKLARHARKLLQQEPKLLCRAPKLLSRVQKLHRRAPKLLWREP